MKDCAVCSVVPVFESVKRLAEWSVVNDGRARKAARVIRRRRLGDWADIRQEARIAALTSVREWQGRSHALSTHVVNQVAWRLMTIAYASRAAVRRDALRIAEALDVDVPEPSERQASLERVGRNAELSASIDRTIRLLHPREQSVLRLRFGIQGSDAHTLRRVARLMKLSPERVRQLELRALRKLRSPRRGAMNELFERWRPEAERATQ